MTDAVTVYACGPSTDRCQCDCPNGTCEHKWDGPDKETVYPGGSVSVSATCSRCGMSAMAHDMWVLP